MILKVLNCKFKTISITVFIILLSNNICTGQIIPIKTQCESENVSYTPNPTSVCPEYNDEILVFEDDFNGTKLDRSKWLIGSPDGNFGILGWEIWGEEGNNIEVSNGTLKLTTKYQPGNYFSTGGPSGPSIGYFQYTSGQIQTTQLFHVGKFEIRCRMPNPYSSSGYGAHECQSLNPAFWIFGTSCSQEIDCFEFLSGNTQNVQMTYHRNLYCSDLLNESKECHDFFNDGTDFSDGFHVFSVDYDKYKITWKIDGVIRREVTSYRDPTFLTPKTCEDVVYGGASQSLYHDLLFPEEGINSRIIIDIALQGVNDASNTFLPPAVPKTFEIDYVKAWQKINCSEIVDDNLCSYTPNVNATAVESFVMGDNIAAAGVGCSYYIPGWTGIDYVSLCAREKVDLLPGFHADLGSKFNARIVSCIPNDNKSMTQNTSTKAANSISTKDSLPYVTLSPNPTRGEVNINVSPADHFVILKIYDIIGSEIYSQKITAEVFSVDLSNLSHGIYFVYSLDKLGNSKINKLLIE
jgi:beta-glucanase (GH16 family)